MSINSKARRDAKKRKLAKARRAADAQPPKPIEPHAELRDREPLLSPEMLDLTRWMARRYLSSWGQVIESVVPAGVKAQAGTREIQSFVPAEGLAETLKDLRLSKKQRTVSRSTAEAEFRALADASCEIEWVIRIMADLLLPTSMHVHIYGDNTASLYIANNSVYHECTKHVELDCYTIRERINVGMIKTMHVRTHNQLADVLTKALYPSPFRDLISKMGVLDLYTPPS